MPTNTFRLISNYTLIGEPVSLAAAKREAVAESNRFEDAVIIEVNGYPRYMARYGGLYSLRRQADPR
jgi:hypothetical protein